MLETIRVGNSQEPVGDSAPIRLLASVPSDECGCPEELWRVGTVDFLIHMEENGTGDIIVYTGDEEREFNVLCSGMDDLRVKMFEKVREWGFTSGG